MGKIAIQQRQLSLQPLTVSVFADDAGHNVIHQVLSLTLAASRRILCCIRCIFASTYVQILLNGTSYSTVVRRKAGWFSPPLFLQATTTVCTLYSSRPEKIELRRNSSIKDTAHTNIQEPNTGLE